LWRSVIRDVEHTVGVGQLDQTSQARRWRSQRQPAAGVPGLAMSVEKDAHGRGVKERAVGEINDELPRSQVERLREKAAQAFSGLRVEGLGDDHLDERSTSRLRHAGTWVPSGHQPSLG
jgi:hypothetical protein